MTFDSVTFDDRPFYQRIGYKLGSRPITMTHENPANAPARITAPTVESEIAAFNAQPGANFVQKGIALLSSRNPAFKELEFGEQCRRGGMYARQLMAGKTVVPAAPSAGSGAAPTRAELAASILAEIQKMPGADLVAKTVAFCKANSVVALTSVSSDLQNQAATALIARLQKGDPTDFAGTSADTSNTSQLAARMPTNVQGMVDEFNAQPGPNAVAKAISLLQSRDPGFNNLPWAEQCRRGGEFSRTLMAGKLPVL
jgi:hypothetical protein